MGQTSVSIAEDRFLINGRPTYDGRTYRGSRIDGLLMNARMVQAIFDDENPETRPLWAYPDTGAWDPERNVRECLAAMPAWRDHGLLAITVNLQGGCPHAYCRDQPWESTALAPDGSLKPAYLDRLGQVIDRADELGMVVILGLFYFGQDERLQDEAAVIQGVENAVQWVLERDDGNVLIEINNECDVPRYEHAILQPDRVHELIERARSMQRNGRRLLVGTSFRGGALPTAQVVAASDVVLLHGNGVDDPAGITRLVERTRALSSFRPKPILFNEDDHFAFDQPENNMLAAIHAYASWGYFDAGDGAGGHTAHGNYRDGYQNVPVNWGINTARKQAFFAALRDVTGN
ncbi:MAG: cellulase family glycosylhydrolase [Thermomicrobiales bacterium]